MADVRALQADYLFDARRKFGASDYAAQIDWLGTLYDAYSADRTAAEITAQSFEGASHSAQYRGATPEELRQAVRLAIEHLEVLSGATRRAPAPGLKLDFSYRTTST